MRPDPFARPRALPPRYGIDRVRPPPRRRVAHVAPLRALGFTLGFMLGAAAFALIVVASHMPAPLLPYLPY